MSVLEATIEGTVEERAEALGYTVRKLKWIGRRNAPDRLFAKPGRHVLIEFKKPGKEPNIGQLREIERLRAAGFEVYWADSVEGAIDVLR